MKICHLILLAGVVLGLMINIVNAEDQEKKPPEYVQKLLGCWQGEKDKEKFIRFEINRCISNYKGNITVFGVDYKPDKVILKSWGSKIVCTVEIKEDVFKITDPTETNTYRKLNKTPPELELKPFVIGKAKDLPADKVKEIQEELSKRMVLDQAVRTNPDKRKEMPKTDADNTAYLKKLVQEIGWIDGKRFGKDSANAAFLIVQHSGDLLFMLASLPCIEQDVKGKYADTQNYALLYDRVQLNLGGKQRYGSQFIKNEQTGEWIVPSLENKEKVEEFRKEIGLFPLSVYLKIIKQQTGIKEIRILEDEPETQKPEPKEKK